MVERLLLKSQQSHLSTYPHDFRSAISENQNLWIRYEYEPGEYPKESWFKKDYNFHGSAKNPIIFIINNGSAKYAGELLTIQPDNNAAELGNIQRINAEMNILKHYIGPPSIRYDPAKEYGSVDKFLQNIGFEISSDSQSSSFDKVTYTDESSPSDSANQTEHAFTNSINSDRNPNSSRSVSEPPSNQERETIENTRKKRDPEFPPQVKSAYDETCAICGANRYSIGDASTAQGKPEVEAAHIKPVEFDGPDNIQNGIALCRLHHWAFDEGWVSIDDDYTIIVRERPNRDEYDEFIRHAGNKIKIPDLEKSRPATKFLQWHRHHHGFE